MEDKEIQDKLDELNRKLDALLAVQDTKANAEAKQIEEATKCFNEAMMKPWEVSVNVPIEKYKRDEQERKEIEDAEAILALLQSILPNPEIERRQLTVPKIAARDAYDYIRKDIERRKQALGEGK